MTASTQCVNYNDIQTPTHEVQYCYKKEGGSSIIQRSDTVVRRFDSQKVLGFFPILFYKCWLYISSQLKAGLALGLELVKMHIVAVYTLGLSNLWTIKLVD